ncbi:MAG TPA: isochorismatase family cysteine hydrolase [Chloroflexota bacterium]|nr:isochorismatase family cysteine hydrolase [Chloroflexota bacterium]
MPARNPDLHGNVPDQSAVALVMIDVINDFEYDTGSALYEHALPIAPRLAALKKRCRESKIPVVYVNDNFGRWRSDQRALVEHCLEDGVRGEPFVRQLLPDEDDYFVLKPKHSGFYSTTLDTLLNYLNVRTLILTGLTGDYCVLFTASDAFLRDFRLVVPADCIASADEGENEHALRHMQRVLDADVSPSDGIDLTKLLRDSRRGS